MDLDNWERACFPADESLEHLHIRRFIVGYHVMHTSLVERLLNEPIKVRGYHRLYSASSSQCGNAIMAGVHHINVKRLQRMKITVAAHLLDELGLVVWRK